MLRHSTSRLALVGVALTQLGSGSADPYFGEALFHAHQGEFFEALERLDQEILQHHRVDESELDSLHPYIGEAEFSVGDFELNYRMHHRAGRAIRAVLEADVPDGVRNEAAFRLARIHFQKDQLPQALQALEGIRGDVPQPIVDDVEFLRANIYLASGRPTEAADVLEALQGSDELQAFAAYNLGIALLEQGRAEEALRQLERAGRVNAGDPATLAIRDKSNLVLGTLLFEAKAFPEAQRSLDRVRLTGPFSNSALLRAGWSDLSGERFERALVPWSVLRERDPTDAAVQEAMLALPFAYSKLDIHGRAAQLYGQAVESFTAELGKLDASIQSIRHGEFLKALVREEIRQDKDWVLRLRQLPEAPETFYLVSLMASHDFQTALQNYLDLETLRRKLVKWQRSFTAFDDLIRLRGDYYTPKLPAVDTEFRELDSRMRLRLEQREHLAERLDHMLIAPRPDQLATAAERTAAMRIGKLEESLGSLTGPGRSALQHRLDRLAGVLSWRLETHYHERLTEAHTHLRELEANVEVLRASYDSFVRARQAAQHSYTGYTETLDRLRGRVSLALDRVAVLMKRQGHVLETVAIAELQLRRERLEAYQNQARFAFADSYDRAAKAQAAADLGLPEVE